MDQLEIMCSNVHGHAYLHGIQHRQVHRIVYTAPISSKCYRTYLDEFAPAYGQRNPPNILTDWSKEQPGSVKCMVVGLVLGAAVDEKILRRTALGRNKRKSIGFEVPENVIETIDFSKDPGLPYLAVVEMRDNMPPGGTKLYALVDTYHGLPAPYNVSQSEVFYFREFRDSNMAIEGRKVSWNQLVLKASVQNYANQGGLPRAIKTAVGENSEQIKQNMTLGGVGPVHDSHLFEPLRLFVALDEAFEAEDAENVIDACNVLWPESNLNANCIMSLRQSIQEQQLTIPTNTIREFLVLSHYFLSFLASMKPDLAQPLTKEHYDNVAGLALEAATILNVKETSAMDSTRMLLKSLDNVAFEVFEEFKEAEMDLKGVHLAQCDLIRKSIHNLGLRYSEKMAAQLIGQTAFKKLMKKVMDHNTLFKQRIKDIRKRIEQMKAS